MKIFTSRYANNELRNFEGAKIAISRGMPRFRTSYKINGQLLSLAPSRQMLSINDKETYKRMYIEQLDNIGYDAVVRMIETMSLGYNAVLLCFEDVRKPSDWCHRTMLAEWLESKGTTVMELEAPKLPGLDKPKLLKPEPDKMQMNLFTSGF